MLTRLRKAGIGAGPATATAPRWVASEHCARCLLTPTGARLIEDAARALAVTRGEDGSWISVRCDACGCVSSVVDLRDGSCFGASVDALSGVEPVEPPTRPFLDDGAPRKRSSARGSGTRRRLVRRWAAIAVGGLATLLVAGGLVAAMLAWPDRVPAGSREDRATGSRPAAAETEPAAIPIPPSAPVAATGAAGTAPAGIAIGQVETAWIQDRLTAVTRIRNEGPQPLPASEVRFALVDGSGHEVDGAVTLVELLPGETKTVVVAPMQLNAVPDGSIVVRVSVSAPPEPVSAELPGGLVLSGVHVGSNGTTAFVRGSITDPSGERTIATLGCALRGADGRLAGVAVGTVDLASAQTRSFALRVWAASTTDPYHVAGCDAS